MLQVNIEEFQLWYLFYLKKSIRIGVFTKENLIWSLSIAHDSFTIFLNMLLTADIQVIFDIYER